MSIEIKSLTEKERLIYLKEFLESEIKVRQEELEDIKVRIKRLEMSNEIHSKY